MPYIRDLNHGTFPAFLQAQRAAIVLLRTSGHTMFPDPLAEFFYNEHSHNIDFCRLNRDVYFEIWAQTHFKVPGGGEILERPDGFYLFIDEHIVDYVPITHFETPMFFDAVAVPIIERFKPHLALHLSQPKPKS